MKGTEFIKELNERGIIQDITNEEKVINALNNNHKLYVGFDPSFKSIHLGNFVVVNILTLARKYDIPFIAIVGGLTGQIGDPSGKKAERKLLDVNQVKLNVNGIKTQLEQLLPGATVINNAQFYEGKSLIDFLRDVGKFVNISYLLNKEIIKNRLESGISFTEFAYSLIQANDFYILHHDYDVDVEIGGSDQWGNITIGTDFINKKDELPEASSPVCGFTLKLLLKADGSKFGKSEKGAVYLNPEVTSPYTMYQFLINQTDADAVKLLNFLSDYSPAEIAEIAKKHEENTKLRFAQNKLAQNLVSRIHGVAVYEKVKKLSEHIFKGELADLNLEEIKLILNDFPLLSYDFNFNQTIGEILVDAQAFNSKSELRTLASQDGLSINGVKVNNIDQKLSPEMVLFNQYIMVKSGKQNIKIIAKKE